MTRHSTHVGELAAGRTVAALPSVVWLRTAEEKPQRDPMETTG